MPNLKLVMKKKTQENTGASQYNVPDNVRPHAHDGGLRNTANRTFRLLTGEMDDVVYICWQGSAGRDVNVSLSTVVRVVVIPVCP